MASNVSEISPQDLRTELESSDPPVLIDVREQEELAISALPGATWIPMNRIIDRSKELDVNRKTVVICRTGARSANVVAFLARSGFKDVRNLSTGINGWAKDVDPSLTVY